MFETIFGGRGFHQQRRGGADLHGSIHIGLEEAFKGVVKEIELPSHGGKGGHQTLRVKIPASVKI